MNLKRIWALFLSLIMVITLLPTNYLSAMVIENNTKRQTEARVVDESSDISPINATTDVNIDETFSDVGLRNLLKTSTYDTTTPYGVLSKSEILAITSLSLDASANEINDTTGIDKLYAIKTLTLNGDMAINDVTHIAQLESLTISNNSTVTYLNLDGNFNSLTEQYGIENLTSLTISNCTGVESFYLQNIPGLSSVNLSGMPNLTNCSISSVNLSSLTLANNHKLASLSLSNSNNIKKLDLKTNTTLKSLFVHNCSIIENIDISNSPNLETLNINDLTKLNTIDLSNNSKLKEICIAGTKISNINLNTCTLLEKLSLTGCPLTALSISNNTLLEKLDLSSTSLSSLDWSNNSNLTDLDISNTSISNNDFSGLVNLAHLTCYNCNFNEIILADRQEVSNISNGDRLNIGYSVDRYLTVTKQSDGSYIGKLSKLLPSFATKYAENSSNYSAVYYPNGRYESPVTCSIDSNGIKLPASFVDSNNNKNYVRIRQVIGKNRANKAITYDLYIIVTKTDVNDSVIDFNATNFPDSDFRRLIQEYNYNAVENNRLKIAQVKYLYISNYEDESKKINLKGIELLTELKTVNIYKYNVSNLNLKNCNKLENVSITNTNLDTIEFGNVQSLTNLSLDYNNLTSINTSKMINLNYLYIRSNKLKSLDLRNNNKLIYVFASNNSITDFKGPSNPTNNIIYDLNEQHHNVNIIKGSDGYYYANDSLLAKYAPGSDEISSYEYNSMLKAAYWSNMGWKWVDDPLEGEYSRVITLRIPAGNNNYLSINIALINSFDKIEDKIIEINSTNFPDEYFRQILSKYISADGKLHSKEVTSIQLNGIKNLKGLELLTELRRVNFYNCKQKSVDFSKNTKLTSVMVSNCGFSSLNLSKQKFIKRITSYDFMWQIIVPEGNEIELQYYPSTIPQFTATKGSDGKYRLTIPSYCQLDNRNLFNASETFENGAFVWNKLSDIPITLTYDYLISGVYSEDNDYNDNQILVNHLQITNNSPADPVDKIIDINSTNFPDEGFRKYLKDMYGNTVSSNKVTSLCIYDSDEYYIDDLTGIQLFTNLRSLSVSTPVKKIDLSKNVNLCSLAIMNASLTKIDISSCKYLEYLDLRYNALTSIDLTNCKNIRTLIIFDNALTKIDVSGLLNLRVFDISNNSLTKIDVSKNILLNELNVAANALSTINLKKNTNLISLNVRSNRLSSIDLSAQKTKLKYFEINDNHGKFKKIDLCGFTKLNTLDINDIEVCMDYKNVPYGRSFCLGSCMQGGPCKLTNKSLTLTGANRLRFVNLNDVSVSSINLKDCRRMQYLYMNNTKIKSLDISKCIYLMELEAMGNSISSISFKNLDSLKLIRLSNNKLSKIDVTMLPALKDLWLSDNNISSIDVTKNPALKYLYIANNPITYLDLSNNEAMLEYTDISGMSLPALNTSKNKILSSVSSGSAQNVKAKSVDVEKKSGKYIITFDKLGKDIDKSKIKNVKGAKLTDKGFEVNKSGGKFASFTYSYNLSNSYHLQNSSMSVNVKFTDPGINKSSVTLYYLGSSKWEKENSSEKLVFENVSKNAKIKWSSSNKKVVSVSSKGVITPNKVGKATITAVYNNKKYTCKVTVKNPIIKLKSSSVTVKKGKTVSIKYTVAPKDKGIWYDDNKIAQITQVYDGVIKIKGLKKGTTTIRIGLGATVKKIKVKVK